LTDSLILFLGMSTTPFLFQTQTGIATVEMAIRMQLNFRNEAICHQMIKDHSHSGTAAVAVIVSLNLIEVNFPEPRTLIV